MGARMKQGGQLILAAIDIGTNSTRLMVAQVDDKVIPLEVALETPRLGWGIGRQKSFFLDPQAMERTLDVLRGYREKVGSIPSRVVATSAVRDAANREEFLSRVQKEVGWEVEVLSGDMEARLEYLGATGGQTGSVPMVLLDIGGGSTEMVYPIEGELRHSSLNLGAVRVLEGNMSPAEVTRELAPFIQPLQSFGSFVFLCSGGTATNLASVALGLKKYSRDAVQGFFLQRITLEKILKRISRVPLTHRERVLGLPPGRADIILSGALILHKVLAGANITGVRISDCDLLDGVLLDMALNIRMYAERLQPDG